MQTHSGGTYRGSYSAGSPHPHHYLVVSLGTLIDQGPTKAEPEKGRGRMPGGRSLTLRGIGDAKAAEFSVTSFCLRSSKLKWASRGPANISHSV